MPYQTSTFHGYHSILRKFIGIDPALVGETLDRPFIDTLVEKTESFIHQRIKYLILTTEEMRSISPTNRYA